MLRAVATAATGSLLALVLLGGAATPAAAAGNELLVSTDGVNFAPDSALPLFTSMGRVVPGDRSTEQVWLRNDSDVDAVLRVDLVDPSADDPALADAFSLSMAAPGGESSSPVTIADGVSNGECTVLGGGIALAPGASLRLELTASVGSALGGQHGTLGTVSFRLRGVLVETAAAGEVKPGGKCQEPEQPVQPPAPGPGRLPNTGSGSLLPLGRLAGVAILVGSVCCVLAWRRREPGDEAAAGG
jgi:hypothetical protein